MQNSILDKIAKEKLENTGTLDLSIGRMKSIPHELLELTDLRCLTFKGKAINDYSPLAKLPALQTLNLEIYHPESVKSLQKLSNIETINLYLCKIATDFSALEKISGLKKLNLTSQRLSNCNFLENIKSLQEINLTRNIIDDYSFLEKLPNLKALHLNSNKINDISFLENLGKLQELHINNNKIRDLKSLSN